jgi:ankyrin repeat protein
MTGNAPLLRAVDPAQQLSRNFNRTSDSASIVRALVAAGADLTARDSKGDTPGHYAKRELQASAPEKAREMEALLRAGDAAV